MTAGAADARRCLADGDSGLCTSERRKKMDDSDDLRAAEVDDAGVGGVAGGGDGLREAAAWPSPSRRRGSLGDAPYWCLLSEPVAPAPDSSVADLAAGPSACPQREASTCSASRT